MKKVSLLGLLFFTVVGTLSCADRDEDESKTLARINGYRLTLEEFDRHIAEDLEMDDTYKVTEQAKRDTLEALIRQQLLIQEAKRRNLDTKEAFVQAIQRYWESTLIRNLLDEKAKEITGRIYVSEEEVTARYDQLKQHQPSLPPLEQVAERIRDDLEEEKKTQMLEAWTEDLKEKADIEVNEELL
jgi:hypothetical protein